MRQRSARAPSQRMELGVMQAAAPTPVAMPLAPERAPEYRREPSRQVPCPEASRARANAIQAVRPSVDAVPRALGAPELAVGVREGASRAALIPAACRAEEADRPGASRNEASRRQAACQRERQALERGPEPGRRTEGERKQPRPAAAMQGCRAPPVAA